ncbi:MAG: 4Fe-4S dicluster domain-containing protein [Candidatus Aminicenantes bacterium]|nr:4Fe-4S dicluster domain-containing protein [Candidatus Aminicenantes bacterium]
MAHRTARDSYHSLVERLNRFPQGAPPSELLFRILKILFSEREAGLVASLPIKPFTAAKAARAWKMPLGEARDVLDSLAGRGILIDGEHEGTTRYSLPPPMAGFFEFSMMRVRGDIDQKLLARLFYRYLNVEEDFIKALFVNGETQLGRVFVDEGALPEDKSLHVLDYERASEVVKTARHRAVGVCYCRHKMEHAAEACDAPMDICLTFGNVADSLSRHGVARAIDVAEGLDLLQQARDRRLVQFGENVRRNVAFICNCCGCCCEALIGIKRFGSVYPIHTNFLPRLDAASCTGCGQCVDVCPVQALSLVSSGDPKRPRRRVARLDERVCLGCGVCIGVCDRRSLTLEARTGRVLTPVNTVHRTVVMAIERGTLAHLVFDNRVQWNHRAMAAVLGVILKLPPLKQALASRQLKSRYLERLIERVRV